MSIYSSKTRGECLILREKGKTHREISRDLHVPLGTVHLWTRHIILSDEVQRSIRLRHIESFIQGRKNTAHKKKQERITREKVLADSAKLDLDSLSEKEFFILGLSLYWAEGFKKDHSLGFVNSDHTMVVFFLKWITKFGDIDKNDIRLRVQIHEIYRGNIQNVESFWSGLVGIPTTQFQKPFFQKSLSKPTIIDPNYYGLLRIRVVNSRGLFVKILAWIEKLRQLSVETSL